MTDILLGVNSKRESSKIDDYLVSGMHDKDKKKETTFLNEVASKT